MFGSAPLNEVDVNMFGGKVNNDIKKTSCTRVVMLDRYATQEFLLGMVNVLKFRTPKRKEQRKFTFSPHQ